MSRALLLIYALGLASGAWGAIETEQAVLWLEGEDESRWAPALHALLPASDSRLYGSTVSSVLKRLDRLEPTDRARAARGLQGRIEERRVRDALARLLGDSDEPVRDAAASALTHSYKVPIDSPQEAAEINRRLASVLKPSHPDLPRIVAAMTDLYLREHAPLLGVRVDDLDAFRTEAARRSLPDTQAEPYFSALLPLASQPDWQVHGKAFGALSVLIDGRLHDALLQLARTSNEYLVENALETLVKRGAFDAVCAPLQEWALSPTRVRAGSWRYQRIDYAGYQCAARDLPAWVERYRQAGGAAEKADYRRLIENAPSALPQQQALLLQLQDDRDAFLADFARQRLAPRPVAHAADPRDVARSAGRGVAVVLMLASLLLGIATLLWGLRVLQVRRLLRHLGVSNARSVAPGLASLEGEVQPAHGKLLSHPDTAEACIYYMGAEKTALDHRFWLVDDSGRVLVEPRGAFLLSEDGMLVPGERVRLIGTAQRLPHTQDQPAATVLRAGASGTSAFARTGRRLLQLVMDRPTTGLLFSDPRRSLLIWDDLRGAPFASPRETMLMFLSFFLSALWILAFFAAALTIVDQGIAGTIVGLVR